MEGEKHQKYISTKLLLVFSILLFIVFNTVAQYYYSNNVLHDFFVKEADRKQRQYEHTLRTLYVNWTRSIENIAGIIVDTELLEKTTQQKESQFRANIDQRAKSLYYGNGLISIVLTNNRAVIGEWKANNVTVNFQINFLKLNATPVHEIVCIQECLNYSYIPVNSNTHLVLVLDITDLLIDFYNATDRKLYIDKNTLPSEHTRVNRILLNTDLFENPTKSFYVIDNNHTNDSVATSLRNRFIIVAAVSTLLLLTILLLLLIPPLKRLEKITLNLPLLASNKFSDFRSNIGKENYFGLMDIDKLHLNALNISYQLEAFFNNLAVNNEVASNMPGALVQFIVLPHNTTYIKYVSDGIVNITGYFPSDYVGSFSSLLDQIHHDDRQDFLHSVHSATNSMSPWTCEFRIFDKQHNLRWLRLSSVPKLARDTSVTWNGVILDITFFKSAMENANKAEIEKKAAEESAKIKEIFFSNISHEIRTPLNTIVGISHLMKNSAETYGDREFINNLYCAAQYLLLLINNVLEQSAIDAGKTHVISDCTSIHKLIYNVRDIALPLATQKNLSIEVFLDRNTPEFLRVDEVKLKQILMNFLSNAIKHTNTGNVILSLELINKTADQVKVKLSVRDTGKGIPASEQHNIFNRFHSLGIDDSSNGLGLAITKDLVTLMGGSIGFNSTVSKGSEFWILLDLEITDTVIGSIKEDTGNANSKLLVVDDNDLNVFTAKNILSSYGYEVETTNSPLRVTELLSHSAFDMVLMDYHMPGINGLQLADQLRDQSIQLPILIYTADAAILKKVNDHNIQGVLLKPLQPDDLYQAINQILHQDCINTHTPRQPKFTHLNNLVAAMQTNEQLLSMADIYQKQLTTLQARALEGVRSNDTQLIAQAIHQLKSNAGTVGDSSLSKLILDIENALKSNHWPSVVNTTHQLANVIKTSIESLDNEIKNIMKLRGETNE